MLMIMACGTPPTLEAETALHLDTIWTGHCSGCHTDGGDNGSLNLDNYYDEMVDVPSTQVDMLLVEPGSPDQSYLVYKLQATQREVGGSGTQMPMGYSLDDEELHAIIGWIEDGAPEQVSP